MANRFLYGRPDESVMFGTVTGTVDTDYTVTDLTNGNPWDPIKRTGVPSFVVSPPASRTIGIVALFNHNEAAGATITVGTGVTATLTVPALGADSIPLAPFSAINSVVGVTAMTVSASSGTHIWGEFWASQMRTLPKQITVPFDWDRSQPFEWENAPPYDTGSADLWRLSGTMLLTDAQVSDVRAWYESTRRGTRPSLVVQDESINDARLVKFKYSQRPSFYNKSVVTFEFVEVLPRVRW